jgi:hypothetical protein
MMTSPRLAVSCLHVHRIVGVLDGLAQGAGGDAADDGNLDEIVVGGWRAAAGLAIRGLHQTQGPRLHILPGQVALPLERAQVVVDPIGAANAKMIADFTKGGWVPPRVNRVRNVLKHRLLACR